MSVITPVRSKIPSSPEQEMYNILEFGGINCAENPFAVSSGSAAELKNLYINDEGTLATRPRLNWEETLTLTPSTGKVLTVLKVKDDYYIYAVMTVDNEFRMYERNGDEFNDIGFIDDDPTGDITSENDFSLYINSEDVVIFICKSGMYWLDTHNFNNVQNSDKAYIPTTKQGVRLNDPTTYVDYESPNLLTNKYKESYFFDVKTSEFDNTTSKYD